MSDNEVSEEEIVERHFAAELGWDLGLFHGQPFPLAGLNLRMSAPYTISNPAAFFLPGQARLSHLRLTKWLKFGNALEQLHCLFLVAQAYDIRQIVLPDSKFFRPQKVEQFELIPEGDKEPEQLGVGVSGVFYYLEPFRLLASPEEEAAGVRRFVRPLLAEQLRTRDPRVGEHDLVLHFRAGDVFSYPIAHYGQPPLAYYLGVLEREQPPRTWLVFEDWGNPCIDAVDSWLKWHGLEVILQSGTLEEDLRVLLSARRLAVGVGTFGFGVAMLSTRLQRLYSFKAESWDYLRLPDVEMIQCADALGDYAAALLSQNWTGSSEQLGMMLSYPEAALRFDPVS
jgi:hypothetical protein